jgi:hypothetical protein
MSKMSELAIDQMNADKKPIELIEEMSGFVFDQVRGIKKPEASDEYNKLTK